MSVYISTSSFFPLCLAALDVVSLIRLTYSSLDPHVTRFRSCNQQGFQMVN
jgi:hypothetical protein